MQRQIRKKMNLDWLSQGGRKWKVYVFETIEDRFAIKKST